MACTSGETRPSKLRLPESTAAAMTPLAWIDWEIFSGSGPELPMQVVQPKPTILKPSLSSDFCRPALTRYSATTCEPGASEVLTQGATFNPLATAFCASRPAPIMTLGFEVLVQEVMAAITTSPWPRSKSSSSTLKRLARAPIFLYSASNRGAETLGDGVERNAAFRTLRAGERRDDRAEFE